MLIREDPGAVRGAGRHALSDLAVIAHEWGYGGEMSCTAHPASGVGVPALAEGVIATRKLASGPNLCASDLTTLCDNERVAVLKKSVMIAVNLDGSPVTYAVEGGFRLQVAAGGAVAISSAADLRMTAVYRRGESSRLLVIQYCPSEFADQSLAEQLDAHLADTRVTPLVPSGRARALAQELFAPSRSGLVGQLLAESCALELLARTIEAGLDEDQPALAVVHPRDVARIHRLCDRLRSNLDAEHRLSDLAREAGMSTSALKSKFLAVTGQPVFRFLRDQRLDRARAGLMQEGWTVSQAAYYVGYRHPTNFATAYRKRFGMAPTAARGMA